MKAPAPVPILAMMFAIACVSCGDSPELVEKREKQKAEIARLKGDLALVEARLKNLPPDVSDELEEARKTVATQKEEVTALQEEIAALEKRKSELQAEYDAYRAKYAIN